MASQPPQIIINPARQKMVRKLALYEDGVLDSLQLLSSGSLRGSLGLTPGPPARFLLTGSRRASVP